MPWIFAALLQFFIVSFILMQCSGKKNDKKKPNDPVAKKPETPAAKKDEPAKKGEAPKSTAPPGKVEATPKPEDKPAQPPKDDAKPKESQDKPKSAIRSAKKDRSAQLETTQAASVRGNSTSNSKNDREPSARGNSKSVNNTKGDTSEVKIDPDRLRFKAGEESAKVTIQNLTDKRLALKVKCSDNEIYKYKPVFFCLEPNAQHNHEVKRKKDAESKPDKLIIVYTEADDSDDARKIYEAKPPAKELMVGIIVK